MTQRQLAVITVNYNGGEALLANIAGWWPHRRSEWELTVVDNASSDGSADALITRFPEIRLLKNSENRGFAAACNQALAEVNADFVLLLNPDVGAEAGALSAAVDYLERHEKVGIAGARIVLPNGRVDPAAHRTFKSPMTYVYKMTGLSKLFPRHRAFGRYYLSYLADDVREALQVDSVTGAFLMIRSRVIAEIGPLDERFFMYCEDEDWCWRAKQSGWEVVYLPDVVVHHAKGSSARKSRVRTTWEWHKSLILYHRKNIAPRYPLPINWAVYAGILLGLALRFPAAALRSIRKN